MKQLYAIEREARAKQTGQGSHQRQVTHKHDDRVTLILSPYYNQQGQRFLTRCEWRLDGKRVSAKVMNDHLSQSKG